MRFEVGKKYWRVKEDGGVYSFTIMKGIREARQGTVDAYYFMDTYYDENEKQVIVDTPIAPLTPPNALIFDCELKATEYLIEKLQKHKEQLGVNEYVKRANSL